jgi:hypothetical protein
MIAIPEDFQYFGKRWSVIPYISSNVSEETAASIFMVVQGEY